MSNQKKRGLAGPVVGSKKVAFAENSEENAQRDEEILVEQMDGLVFEDPYGDEFEEESVEDEEEEEDDREADGEEGDSQSAKGPIEDIPEPLPPKQVWKPGIDKLPEGEELEYDPSAYIMYHSMRTEWPCLSFDVIRDNLGDNRLRFPLSMYLVTGSQADRPEKNKLTILSLSDLHKTYVAPDSDDEDNDEKDEASNQKVKEDGNGEDDLDEDPVIDHVNVPHYGGVNRLRNCPQRPGLMATMAEMAPYVNIFDLTALTSSMMQRNAPRSITPGMIPSKPTYATSGTASTLITTEGFAMDWSPTYPGRLAVGDNSGKILVLQPTSQGVSSWEAYSNTTTAGASSASTGRYSGHKSSVEDIQWSPTETTVFASGSSDSTIRIWDLRDASKAQISYTAANPGVDINVLSWNKKVGYLLVSGADDGSFKVWDLRKLQTVKGQSGPSPLAYFSYHSAAITSIEWNPHDESMLACASADDSISIWDLSVEAEEQLPTQAQAAASAQQIAAQTYPPQLLFLHLGQTNIKELHFHPQIPGAIVTTAEDSFNVFKPAITVSS